MPIYIIIILKLGLLKEAEGNLQDALLKYEKVLTVDGNHTSSLIRMAAIYIQLEKLELAEVNLRAAVHLDPSLHEAWYYLGVVYEKTSRLEKSAECFVTALEFENTGSVRPFGALPRKLEHDELTFLKDTRPLTFNV